jgi:hypothetical protein
MPMGLDGCRSEAHRIELEAHPAQLVIEAVFHRIE